jgi:hypothetical protein
MRQYSIGSGPAGTLIVSGDPDNPISVLIQNVDANNTVYLGETAAVNPANPNESAPLEPGQTAIADGSINVFAIADRGQTVSINILRGFGSFFQPSKSITTGDTIDLNPLGFFIYDGIPALGNLIASIAPANATDEENNAYLRQITAYGSNAGGFYVATQIGNAAGFGAGINLYTAPTEAGPWSLQATFSTDTSGVWSFNANSYRFLSSGSPSQHVMAADALIQQRQGSTWQGNVPSAQTDVQQISNATAAFQNLTKIYPVPARDVNIGTIYRLTCGGFILFGATVQVLTVQLVFAGFAVTIPIGSAEFFANQTYGWRAQGEFINVSGPQNAALLAGSLSFDLGVGTNNQATVAGSVQTAGGFAQQTTTTAADLTTTRSMAFQGKWGAVSAGNSIVCNYSYVERLGT